MTASKHEAVINAMITAAKQAAPGQRVPAMQQAAANLGYVWNVQGQVTAGPSVGVPINATSLSIGVPFSYDFTAGTPRIDKAGIAIGASFGNTVFTLNIGALGIQPETMERVTSPLLDDLQSHAGLPAKFAALQDDGKLVLNFDAAVGGKVPIEVFGDTGVDYLVSQMSVTIQKADAFIQDIGLQINQAIESLIGQQIGTSMSYNKTALMENLRQRVFEPDFQRNWKEYTILELYQQYKANGGSGFFGGALPLMLNGEAHSVNGNGGRIGFSVRERPDGSRFMTIESTPHLGTAAENEARFIRTYQSFDANGRAVGQPSRISYECPGHSITGN